MNNGFTNLIIEKTFFNHWRQQWRCKRFKMNGRINLFELFFVNSAAYCAFGAYESNVFMVPFGYQMLNHW
ncbi:MAG TPA: hypothetical protein PLE74_11540, partial [Candidatus Cloacimonadota bacterium]|nr:hypothetical protein [Candidatus Cloacimonadota bacterium]